jgi:hypothetical protein
VVLSDVNNGGVGIYLMAKCQRLNILALLADCGEVISDITPQPSRPLSAHKDNLLKCHQKHVTFRFFWASL